tara:strand:- start:2490 stop:3407 length:918 start_codon:yes stop_codon:yes gene_type:complete
LQNKKELYKSKNVYDLRWANALKSGDSDIISEGFFETQVQFFYRKYCNFIYKRILEYFPNRDLSKINILEIGCGRGTASIYLSNKLNCRVTGIDFSEISIQIARENSRRHYSNNDFFVADLFDPESIIKSSDNNLSKFDVVISLGVLEHIESIDKCFQIHNQLLVDNGLFCAMIVPEKKSIQDKFSLINRSLIKFNNFIKISKTRDLEHLDKKTLSKTKDVYRSIEDAFFYEEKLKKANFEIVYSIETNPFPTIRPLGIYFEKLLVFIYKLISYIFFFFNRKSIFFNCNKKISRCHFLLGRKSNI